MLDFFHDTYAKIINKNKILTKFKFYSIQRYAVRVLANIAIPIYFSLTKKSILNNKNSIIDNELIISLTSFPARINKVWLTIESLLRQTVKPKKIILWLSRDQFPDFKSIPESLQKLCGKGLTIELRNEDIRSHKKYFYALNDYPDSKILIVDDDILYPSFMIEELLRAEKTHPNTVICRFTKKIKWKSKNEIAQYSEWEKINDGKKEDYYFFGSGGGVLIPPGSIHSDVLNKEAFLTMCPSADDIWLNAMCRISSRKMVSLETEFSALPIINHNNFELNTINNGQNKNDIQIKNTRTYCLEKHGVDPFQI